MKDVYVSILFHFCHLSSKASRFFFVSNIAYHFREFWMIKVKNSGEKFCSFLLWENSIQDYLLGILGNIGLPKNRINSIKDLHVENYKIL